MQTLLVFYMVHQLLLPGHVEHIIGFGPFRAGLESVYGPLSPQALGSVIFGLYAGLVWVTPILGGFVADRLLSRTLTITIGAVLMVIGHFLMAFDQSFLIALSCLLIGVGCFKGNLASQVSGLYAAGDPRAAGAFQIYYLGIQAAVIVTPLVCGTLGEAFGWHWGFGAAGVGMVIGLCLYLRARRWLPPEPPRRSAGGAASAPMSRTDLRNVAILIGLLPVLALVQITASQQGNAYMIWGERNLDLTAFGLKVPVTWLATLDAMGSSSGILLSLLFWRWWARRRAEPDEISKIAMGGVLQVLAPLVLVGAALSVAASGHRASLGWAVLFELIMNLGWANIGPVGLALYARLAPKGANATLCGVFYLQVFLGNMLAGWLGSKLDLMSGANFWLLHAALGGVAALTLLLARAWISRTLATEAPPLVTDVAPAVAG